MSRFLQRLIATAQSPGGSIHPMLRSVYSPTPRAGLAEDTLPVTAPEHWTESPPTALRAGGRPSGGGRTGVDSADRDRLEGAAESRVAFDSRQETDPARDEQEVDRAAATSRARNRVPLVNPNNETRETAAHEDDASWAAATVNSASALRNPSFDRGATAAQAAGTEAAGRYAPTADHEASTTDRDASIAGRYSPMMPANVTGTALAGDSASAAFSLRAPAPDTGEAHGDARRSRRPERGADDIQIHIGRIEVTAAAPAPARAAATPPRQSPSLDEFLKRRPGRGG
jgi:hypothetical protein